MAEAATPTPASRRALVVRGGWEGHSPVATTELFLPFLAAEGFDVRVEDDPAVYADAATMAATDLVVQSVTMSDIGDDAVTGLRTAVAAGTGLVGWHGGIADAFRASAEYLQLIGGQFAAHPGLPTGERDADGRPVLTSAVRHGYALTELGRAHPITAGLDDFELETEQYWVLADDLVDVLATTTIAVRDDEPWHRPVVSPAVWTRDWGRGRIVVATPGHDTVALGHPAVRAILERGMRWASRTR